MADYKRIPDLVEYAKTVTSKDAEAIGVSASYLRLVGYGHKRLSAKAASLLEQHTKGRFKRETLRPDWKEIWPELIELKRI